MTLNILRLVVAMLAVTSLWGCREARIFDYQPVSLEFNGSTLLVYAEGSYGRNSESEEGKKLIDWTFPYYITFTYSALEDLGITSLAVENIKLYGEESGVSYTLEGVSTSRLRADGDKLILRVIVGPLPSGYVDYEDLRLTADVSVEHGDGSNVYESLELVLRTSFRTESNWIWFDKQTSV